MKKHIAILLLSVFSASSHAAYVGDVNGDGAVNSADISSITNAILTANTDATFDVNSDGVVNSADISTITNIILSGNLVDPDMKYVGGDISLLTKYEENGAYYKDKNGVQVTDMLAFYKQIGQNAMRVRLFVNPANASSADKGDGVIQDLPYVAKLGKAIKDAGLKFVLDFHYSDSWADPGKQTLPKQWEGLSGQVLADTVYNYTKTSLQALVAAGAKPDLVQVGNEITYGMLWPSGHTWPDGADYNGGTWANFQLYFNAGARAVREVLPMAKVICHIELSNDLNKAQKFFTKAKSSGLDYDIIGLSYYPCWHASAASTVIISIEKVVKNLETSFPDRHIMIMETGSSFAWAMNDTKDANIEKYYPYTEEGQAKYVTDLVTMLNSHANVKGLFWWWPEQNECGLNWNTMRVTTGWWNSSLVDSRTGQILQGNYELAKFK